MKPTLTRYEKAQLAMLSLQHHGLKARETLRNQRGMEMVQVMIIVAISIAMGAALIGVSNAVVTFLGKAKTSISNLG